VWVLASAVRTDGTQLGLLQQLLTTCTDSFSYGHGYASDKMGGLCWFRDKEGCSSVESSTTGHHTQLVTSLPSGGIID
jgi:hypothetical protein